MKRILLILLLNYAYIPAFSQERNTDEIEKKILYEAKLLYQSEWTSWHGSDIYQANYKTDKAKGYLSYDDGKGMVNVFYSNDSIPQVLIKIAFGYDFDNKKYSADTTKRPLNMKEKELYVIRKAAIDRMNTDTTFKYYKNANLNPVPIIDNGQKRVYVLTGPTISNVVVLGNDYRIDFDKEDKITNVNKLHNSIITINYSNDSSDSSKIQTASIHSHLKSKDEFITATDICTLKLYGKFTTWKTHYVISPTYVSIWDIQKEQLVLLTKEAWDRINED